MSAKRYEAIALNSSPARIGWPNLGAVDFERMRNWAVWTLCALWRKCVATWCLASKNVGTPATLQKKVLWHLYLETVTTCRQITDLLRIFGRHGAADRIDYLETLSDEDPDEPILDFESLRTLASFVLSERHVPEPEIGLTPRGFAVGQWRIPPDGILVMEFHPHAWIRYVGIGCKPHGTEPRQRISRTQQKHKAIRAVQEFTRSLETQL